MSDLRDEIIQSIKDKVDNHAWNETTEICADEIMKIIKNKINECIVLSLEDTDIVFLTRKRDGRFYNSIINNLRKMVE